MKKVVIFLISFISLVIFLNLYVQNQTAVMSQAFFVINGSQTAVISAQILLWGYILGIVTAIPFVFFVLWGGKVKIIATKEKPHDEEHLEWD